jgi:oligopeptidase B
MAVPNDDRKSASSGHTGAVPRTETPVRVWISLLALLLLFPVIIAGAAENKRVPTTAKTAQIEPPVAARKPVRLRNHGIVRVDNYAWLRDKNWREVVRDSSRLAPAIRAYLTAENRYADAVQAPLAGLRATLVAEMKGRIQPQDAGVPMPDGPYSYWRKFVPGGEHIIYVRAPRGGGDEEVLVDGNELAKGRPYFAFGDTRIHSPDHRYFGYTFDDSGSESFTLVVRDLAAKRDLPDVIKGVSNFTWADSNVIYYVQQDDELRSRFVYRHRLGTDPATDPLVYEEKDLQFTVSVAKTSSGRLVAIIAAASDTNEVRIVETAQPESEPRLIQARMPGLIYGIDDGGDRFIVRTNADGAEDYKIMTAPFATPGREHWRDLVPYREGRRIESVDALANHLVRLERENGLGRIVIRRKSDNAEHAVSFDAEAYDVDLTIPYEHNSPTIRFVFASPSTPRHTYDYDLETRERVLRKAQTLPGGHDPGAYVVRRLFAVAADKEQVPVTLLYRKSTPIDGSAPLYIEGYGAYAENFTTTFDANVLSLVDRGFVYAIAHVRGGIEKGERWRNAGRRENKVNTFTDFIAVTEHLIKNGYTARGRIVARGDSAGGLLVGAVANMRPDLFAGMIARVPFVDALNTMLDETLPLTTTDFPEWGDPIRDVKAYRTIASYSPYDNVKAQAYPHMLVTAGISDPRVQFWEPAKWVAKLRAMKTNDARIVLITQLTAGHSGASGRFVELDEAARIAAFALDVTGWREPAAGASAN